MKKATILLVFLVTILVSFPIDTEALSMDHKDNNNHYVQILANKKTTTTNNDSGLDMSKYNQPQNCNTLLGNPSDANSVAWLIDKILTYATIAGMVLVVVLSSIDFMKVIVKSDDDEMAKATRKLAMRLLLAALLFFVPTLTNVMLSIFGLTSDSTCGIQQG